MEKYENLYVRLIVWVFCMLNRIMCLNIFMFFA